MNEQDRINAFTLAAHRVALARLRAQPTLVPEAIGVLKRWREQAGGTSHCDPWESLLREGADAIERAVCAPTDRAATLRSVSPLGRFLTAAERYRLLKQVREAA